MGIELREITQKYGELTAVNNVNLFIEDGEMLALLGPSGCGKTTLLKTIAGLLPLYRGKICFNNEDISKWEAQKRNAAMVFQNYALFPHMSVEENIAYGLKIRKNNKSQTMAKVDEILNKVELSGLNHRKISELSGGQQQRVALARALVIEPSILLFDEPLSNLDQRLRIAMRQKIREIQQEYGITSIYVTHDQEEAMSISDRIAVMKDGIIEQIGTADQVYLKPQNRFVAEFMGIANIVKLGENQELDRILESGNPGSSLRSRILDGGWDMLKHRLLVFRPEDVEIGEAGEFEGTVIWQETIGSVKMVTIDYLGNKIIAEIRNYYKSGIKCANGDRIRFNLDLNEIHLIDD
ncbi:MAG: ABC transporter ATP-binding protein [Syntrophomonadaceae bacterium]|nr:ABC transporter ATP-binding protein [Syntrophomonadaceae bacterium]